MNIVVTVIVSLLVYAFVSPIIDKMSQTLCTYFEVLMAKNSLRITRYNKEIREIQKSLEESPQGTVVVGFGSGNNEEE